MSDGGWSLTQVWSDKYQKCLWYLKRDETSPRLICNTGELDALADLIRKSRGGHTNESEASQ